MNKSSLSDYWEVEFTTRFGDHAKAIVKTPLGIHPFQVKTYAWQQIPMLLRMGKFHRLNICERINKKV